MRDNHGSLRVRFEPTGEEASIDIVGSLYSILEPLRLFTSPMFMKGRDEREKS